MAKRHDNIPKAPPPTGGAVLLGQTPPLPMSANLLLPDGKMLSAPMVYAYELNPAVADGIAFRCATAMIHELQKRGLIEQDPAPETTAPEGQKSIVLP
jgi:hypothetical protein